MEKMMEQTPHLIFDRDCKEPTLEPVGGKIISGTIPHWLEGTLIRNGAGIQTVGNSKFEHYFDGLAMLHRFHIKNGEVTYSNRPLESDSYQKNMKAGRIVSREFGTLVEQDPCESLFSKFKATFLDMKTKDDLCTDNCNVNVCYFGDEIYAMTETCYIRRFDPETLETIGAKTRVDNFLPINGLSAHPHTLPDGTIITMGVNYQHLKGPRHVIIKVPPTNNADRNVFANAKILAEIPCRWKLFPSYSHSFAMAGDNVVFIEQPYCLSLPRFFASLLRPATIESCFQWWPNYTTRIHVVSTTNEFRRKIVYETKDLFLFHQVNAYVENNQIVLDVSAYNSAEVVQVVLGNGGGKKQFDFQNSLRRYILPLNLPKNDPIPSQNLVTLANSSARATLRHGTKNVVDLVPEIISPKCFEFPRINYSFNGKQYRFAYGATSGSEPKPNSLPDLSQISKIDLKNKTALTWSGGEGVLVSEPVFVQNPLLNYPLEDDGVVMVTLLHFDDELKVTMVILDAKTMEEEARIEFIAQGAVTSTLHGEWAQSTEKVNRTYRKLLTSK